MTLPALAFACLVIATLGYVLVCWVSPFATCRKCHGLGFQLNHTRRGKPKRGKRCRRCRGAGARIRRGRHLTNSARKIHRTGARPRSLAGGKP